MTLWQIVLLASIAVLALKLVGYLVPPALFERPTPARVSNLLTVALLAALVAVNTVTQRTDIVLDARLPALVVAGVLLAVRAPFIIVIAAVLTFVILVAVALGGIGGAWFTRSDPSYRVTVEDDRVAFVVKTPGRTAIRSFVTDDDPDFTKLFRRILARQRSELESVIDAAKADKSFRADVDGATLIDAIVGAHIAERARTGRVAAGWEARLFDLFAPVVQA